MDPFLDHTMSLVCALIIACKRVTTNDRASSYRAHITKYIGQLQVVYPALNYRSNHHVSFHIYDFLLLFGPIHSWWTYPFERLIGILQRLPHNHRFGEQYRISLHSLDLTAYPGELEGAIHRAFVAAGNFRRWMFRPHDEKALCDCRELFKRIYSSRSDDDPQYFEERISQDEDLQFPEPTPIPKDLKNLLPKQKRVIQKARLRAHGTVYARVSTHAGNSLVMFHPNGKLGSPAVPGSIECIFANDSDSVYRFAVRRYKPAESSVLDPFRRWPDFPAKIWSSAQSKHLEVVDVNSVMCQFAKYDVSEETIVVVMLPKVRNLWIDLPR